MDHSTTRVHCCHAEIDHWVQPLPTCDGLGTILCGTETLGKHILQHMRSKGSSTRNTFSAGPEQDTDSVGMVVIDRMNLANVKCRPIVNF